jgi:catechol 2,3-dioxygenase-like lactoylglutathione lyase family enzyme
MLDHISISVSDLEKSRAFYDAALAPLGMKRMMDLTAEQVGQPSSGYGDGQRFSFWINQRPLLPTHFAFSAQTRAMVDAFYQSAIAAGAADHGAPGLRPHYHKDYYGAFVLDPDGHNVEAVCRLPE